MTGVANRRASILSKIPPWPGRMVPESLTPDIRFSADSKRSPTCPAAPIKMKKKKQIPQDKYGNKKSLNTEPTKILARKPPIDPSIVFPGLTDGLSLCRPK